MGNHLFVIFAVLDVSCAVNSCINHSFLHLLKLTAASNAGVYEQLAILDEYLVDHCWMLTPDHHLDNRLSLSHVSRHRRRPHVGAINNVHE